MVVNRQAVIAKLDELEQAERDLATATSELNKLRRHAWLDGEELDDFGVDALKANYRTVKFDIQFYQNEVAEKKKELRGFFC